ncbi:hypothetical protein Tco_0047579 [Tanacetum coccineum]
MSQPANDVFCQHLSEDEASYHEDALDNGTATNKPKQQLIPTTTTISNIKLPILKKEEISTGKDGVVRILPPVSGAEIHAVEKERNERTILLMAIPKEHLRRFHGMDDLTMCGDIVKDSNSYLKSRGSIEDFVSFREMITSQLQGKLWLYDEVRTRLFVLSSSNRGRLLGFLI